MYWCHETLSYYPVPTDVSYTAEQTETADQMETLPVQQTQATNGDSGVEKSSCESVTASSQAAPEDKSEDKSKREKAIHAKKIVKVCNVSGDVIC